MPMNTCLFLNLNLEAALGPAHLMSPFLNRALQIKLPACGARLSLKVSWHLCKRDLVLSGKDTLWSTRGQKKKPPWNSKGNHFSFLYVSNQFSQRWRKLLWPFFPCVIQTEHDCFILSEASIKSMVGTDCASFCVIIAICNGLCCLQYFYSDSKFV